MNKIVAGGLVGVIIIAGAMYFGVKENALVNKHDTWPSWGPNGEKIYFYSYRDDGDQGELYVMNADGSEQTRLSETEFTEMFPAISPLGEEIFYVSDQEAAEPFGSGDIFVLNLASREDRKITTDGSYPRGASWAPDGRSILYASRRDSDDDYEIWRVSAAGGEPIKLLKRPDTDDMFPSLSADGRQLVFSSSMDGSIDLYVTELETHHTRRLIDLPGVEALPYFSPDGGKILFTHDSAGNGLNEDLYSINLDGSGLKRLTDEDTSDVAGVWSPDGAHIAYASGRHGPYEIYVMNADGTQKRRLTHTSRNVRSLLGR